MLEVALRTPKLIVSLSAVKVSVSLTIPPLVVDAPTVPPVTVPNDSVSPATKFVPIATVALAIGSKLSVASVSPELRGLGEGVLAPVNVTAPPTPRTGALWKTVMMLPPSGLGSIVGLSVIKPFAFRVPLANVLLVIILLLSVICQMKSRRLSTPNRPGTEVGSELFW